MIVTRPALSGSIGPPPPPLSGTPFITGVTPSTARNNDSACYGFNFNTNGGLTPTITDLGRWKIAGNSQTHTVKLVDVAHGVLASVAIDMSTGSAGGFVYVSITPVVLVANTAYWVLSEEFNGGDQWYDGDTSVTIDSSGGSIDQAAYQAGCSGSISGFFSGFHSYIPVNFKFA